ncbi:RNA polymerase sigma-70 factor, ECF subfamily [Alteracholeplasma palmae J233]|uniref:RNA polymerase sigma-70 factor, ECF subfamily n=1 Tax=Alteracholeplasma palmae (strain ATCC 49389 / J233) TaxID=1318466 RepID=U4KS99_ALTPJ|nr:sigma factor [Alteracholeplasma palmae]CCV64861.1 RNA polymerase sigma-70 factor, ECF subfamily [Alteracholeplasma palmae J233]
MYPIINDYELIYLVQSYQDELSLEYLVGKYERLIWKYIHLLDIPKREQEDYYQEGIMLLHKAVVYFDENKNKTFTRYFELILKRKFFKLKNRLPEYRLQEETHFLKHAAYHEDYEEFEEIDLKNPMEKIIYEAYFKERKKITQIACETNYTKKQIYNTIYRIKEKYKAVL